MEVGKPIKNPMFYGIKEDKDCISVEELIDHLSNFDKDAMVVVPNIDGGALYAPLYQISGEWLFHPEGYLINPNSASAEKNFKKCILLEPFIRGEE